MELAAPIERLKKFPKTYKGSNVSTLAPSFLIGSSFLQVTRTTIKALMSSNFSQINILPLTAE